MKKVLSLFSCILFSWMQAQLGYWQNDTTTKDQSIYAIKNITLYQDYKTVIPDAVLVIQNGKVLESGKVAIPKNAATILTVSDIIPTGEEISADQRETALRTMMTLALESGIKL